MQAGAARLLVEDFADGVIADLWRVKGADDLHWFRLLTAATQAAYHCLSLCRCDLCG